MAKSATKTQQVAFRLPVTILKRLDEAGKRMEAENPGANFSRSDVVRVLLMRGLSEMFDGGEGERNE